MPTTNDLATRDDLNLFEQVVIGGDLSKLSAAQRVTYYQRVCSSVGLNPLTKPFDYITLNGKLTLYARKDAADQLRQLHGISIDKPDIRFEDDWIIVTVIARDNEGRTDSDIGVVNKKDMRGDFGNALMKAVTKAKRRVTLSICGLGMLDETEVETIPTARPVVVEPETGEIVEPPTMVEAGQELGATVKKPTRRQELLQRLFDVEMQAEDQGITLDEFDPANATEQMIIERGKAIRALLK